MNDSDFSLPDFGVLMSSQEPKRYTGSDVTTPDDVFKSFLHSTAPYVDYEEAMTPLNELETNIPDLEALTSSVLPNGGEQKQNWPLRNWVPDSWPCAIGALSPKRGKPDVPVIPATVDGLIASEQLTLKSEHNGWQRGGDCWSSALYSQLSCENQPSRRWSLTSCPSAGETYARQCSGSDDYGCAEEQAQLFGIHGNGHQRNLQFAGNQRAPVNTCGKHRSTRTVEMRNSIRYAPVTDVRSRSMSLTDDWFSYTSFSEGQSRSSQEEDPTGISDELSDGVSVAGQLERRRMSNKTAAMKSRQRKRERTQTLKKEWLDTECDNTRMQYEICQLRKQVASLQGILRDHHCKRRRLSSVFTSQTS